MPYSFFFSAFVWFLVGIITLNRTEYGSFILFWSLSVLDLVCLFQAGTAFFAVMRGNKKKTLPLALWGSAKITCVIAILVALLAKSTKLVVPVALGVSTLAFLPLVGGLVWFFTESRKEPEPENLAKNLVEKIAEESIEKVPLNA